MFISEGKTYQYKAITFDWHESLGPIMLNRHTFNERPWRSVSRRQWALLEQWQRLSKEQQEFYRICPQKAQHGKAPANNGASNT